METTHVAETPVRKPKTTPKDFFLHVLMIITLYASAISVTTILFQVINLTIPDALETQTSFYLTQQIHDMIRSALATLIIMFPAFVSLAWYLQRIFKTNPEKRIIWVRKWLLYFTLFVAALIMLIDLVTLVNSLLHGEFKIRFLLKVLSVLVVSGSIFWYFFQDIRKTGEGFQ